MLHPKETPDETNYFDTFLFLFFIQSYSNAQIADTSLARLYLDSLKMQLRPRNFELARNYGNNALRIYQNAFGEKNRFTAFTLYWLGIVEYENRVLGKSMEIQKMALEIRLKTLGEEHPETADSYHFIGMLYNLEKNLEKAIEYTRKGLEIRLKVYGPKHSVLTKSYNNLGNYYLAIRDLEKALEIQKKNLELSLEFNGDTDPLLQFPYNNIGKIYTELGKYEEAIEYHEKALTILLGSVGRLHEWTAITYESIGVIYYNKQDNNKALQYYQEALTIQLKVLGKVHDRVANLYSNIGICYQRLGEEEKSLEAYQNALNIYLEIFPPNHPYVGDIYHNMGVAASFFKDRKRAGEYLQKSLEIRLNNFSPDHAIVANSYISLGVLYERIEDDYEKAIESYKKVEEIFSNLQDPHHPTLAIAYGNLGNLYHHQLKDLENAILYHQKGLEIQQYLFSNGHPDVIVSCRALAMVYLKQKEFELAKKYINMALSGLEEAKRSMGKEIFKPQFFGADPAFGTLNVAIQHTFQAHEAFPEKYDLEQAFSYAEQNKANELLKAFYHADAKDLVGIPPDVLKKADDLNAELLYFEKKHVETKRNDIPQKDSLLQVYQSRIFEVNQQLKNLINQLDKDYPEYHNLRYRSEYISVEHVQTELLEPNQALIEYFVGQKNIYIFLIKPGDYKILSVEKDFALKDWVRQMRSGIYDYQISGKTDEVSYLDYSDTFAIASFQLYEKLIKPIYGELPEQLIIVPDGILNYIPFEVLLTAKPAESHQFKNHAYLIKDHQISYSFSATHLRELRQKKNNAKKDFLAFAPSFKTSAQLLASTEDRRSNLGPLQFSIPEVEGIQKLLGGEVYVGELATEENFIQLAENYNILHLATHGKANDKAGDYSYLAFTEIEDSLENEFLYVRDLYNMRLNADMVVLSACETGLGELQRGEGVVSLARGFSYAGAKSIITTLWSVSDENTKNLMLPFYQNIKSGMDKDAALRKAKLDYLEQNSHLDAHPFYWAGLVAMGDMEPIVTSSNFKNILMLGLFIIGGLLLFLWLIKKTQKS